MASDEARERVRKMREDAATYAEAAAGMGKRILNPGETQEQHDTATLNLALTSIALSLAAEQLTKRG